MPLTAEQKKKIQDSFPDVFSEVEKLEGELSNVTHESISRKNKIRDFESNQKSLLDKIKAHGIDPEGDMELQIKTLIDNAKTGMKPANEFEVLTKKVDKLMHEVESWKTQAEKAQSEATIEKARAAFSTKLPDYFGPAADFILDYAITKGLVGVKDGVPGVVYDGDFTPLNVEKGKNALDVLKSIYPQFVIVKQKGGSGSPASGGGGAGAGSSDEKTMPMKEFETLPHSQKQQFIRDGGKVAD